MKKILFLLVGSFSLIYCQQKITYSVPSRPWFSRSTDPLIQEYINKTKAFDQKVDQLHKDFAPIFKGAFNFPSYPDWVYKPHEFSIWSLDDLMSAVRDARRSFVFIRNRLKEIADSPVSREGFKSQLVAISLRVFALENAANKLLEDMHFEQARLQNKKEEAQSQEKGKITSRQFYTQVASQPSLFKFAQTRWQTMRQPEADADKIKQKKFYDINLENKIRKINEMVKNLEKEFKTTFSKYYDFGSPKSFNRSLMHFYSSNPTFIDDIPMAPTLTIVQSNILQKELKEVRDYVEKIKNKTETLAKDTRRKIDDLENRFSEAAKSGEGLGHMESTERLAPINFEADLRLMQGLLQYTWPIDQLADQILPLIDAIYSEIDREIYGLD